MRLQGLIFLCLTFASSGAVSQTTKKLPLDLALDTVASELQAKLHPNRDDLVLTVAGFSSTTGEELTLATLVEKEVSFKLKAGGQLQLIDYWGKPEAIAILNNTQTGLFQRALELGRFLLATHLVTGDYIVLQDSVKLNVWLHEIETNASVKGVTSQVFVESKTFPASAFQPRPRLLSVDEIPPQFQAFKNYVRRAVEQLLHDRRGERKRLRIAAVTFENTQVGSRFGDFLRSELPVVLRNESPDLEILTNRLATIVDWELSCGYWAFSDHVVVNLSLVEVDSGLQVGAAEAIIPKVVVPPGLEIRPGSYEQVVSVLDEVKELEQPKAARLFVEPERGRGSTYSEDEEVHFVVKTNVNCYLRILSIGPDGSVTELFPNKFDRSNYIEANRMYRIPGDRNFWIKVHGPAFGTEVVKVVASSAQFSDVGPDAWSRSGTFRSLGNYRGVLRNLGVEPGGKILAEDHFTITTVQRAASP